ncbi:MAG: PEGA domain-containing protein [Methanomicrobiales archaeon]|nr:PEGA domain-containing protein [Methanomicrobiales archaeon]
MKRKSSGSCACSARFCMLLLLACAIAIPAAGATVLVFTVQDERDATAIEGASISIDGVYIGKTDDAGILEYEHAKTDSFTAKITAAGFDDWIDIVSDTATSVTASLSPRTIFLSVVLFDAATLEPVQDVLVKATGDEGTFSGRSDEEGRVDFDVSAGATYHLEIRASRYVTLQRTVTMGSAAREVQYWMYRNDLFVIRAEDADAGGPLAGVTVLIDGQVQGTTGDAGTLALYLERERSYALSVQKDQYQTVTDTRNIGSEDAVVVYTLSRSLYPLSISVFDPGRVPVEGAKVYIDDSLHGSTGVYGSAGIANLKAGVHRIEIRREGFVTWTSEIEMIDGSRDLVVSLEYAPATVTVRVSNTAGRAVAGTSVLVDGSAAGLTDAAGELVLTLPAHHTYNITAVHEGYLPAIVSHDIPSGTSAADVSLVLEEELDLALIGLIGVGLAALIGVALGIRWIAARRRHRRPAPKRL